MTALIFEEFKPAGQCNDNTIGATNYTSHKGKDNPIIENYTLH